MSEESSLSPEFLEPAKSNASRKLSDADRDILLAMLASDSQPNEKLKEAFKAMKDLIAE